MKKLLLSTLFIALTGLSTIAQAQLKVTVTTGMIADLVENIGQDKVKVTALMGAGVDPHLYKATQGDIRRLSGSDLILYNGLHLEGKMQPIFEKLARKKAVFAVSDKIPADRLIHFENLHDPHIWFDVSLWQLATQRIAEILQQQDPENAGNYRKNAENYLKQLEELDQWVNAEIAQIPQTQRILITAHDAFGYFGKAYGLEVRGLQGVSTASEFGLQDIKRLKDIILKNHVKAVFVESSVSPKFIQSLVAGVKAEGGDLKLGGELFSDAMDLQGRPAGNYIGMVKHNVKTIVKALK